MHARPTQTILEAFDMLPPGVAELLIDTPILCGVTSEELGWNDSHMRPDGSSWSEYSFTHYDFGQINRPAAERRTSIILPKPVRAEKIVHELGHVLDQILGWPPAPSPVSAYARSCRAEAFAEGFAAAHCDRYSAAGPFAPWRLALYRRQHPHYAYYFTRVR